MRWGLLATIAISVLSISAHAQKEGSQKQTAKRMACQLLSLEEVAKFAGSGPLEIEPTTSGPGDGESSSCTWQPKGVKNASAVAILTIENLDVPDQVEKMMGSPPAEGRVKTHFRLRKIQTFSNPPEPTAISGLGDEALYRDFENAKGGALLVRRAAMAVTFSGSARRDTYVGLAKLVLQRL